MTSYVPLSYLDLAIAALLVAINGAISFGLSLRLERPLLIATLRMAVQLTALALVLRFIFAQASPIWTVGLAAVMAVGAMLEIIMRQHYRLKAAAPLLLASSPAFLSGLATTLIALAMIQPEPWYAPRILLPILGMLTGNTLTAVALVLDTLHAAAVRERPEIEARLALGASRYEASNSIVRRALKTALMPVINAMSVAGIVALPGMMTGQILAGIDPLEAAKYQILIMLLIAAASAAAVGAAAFAAVHFMTDDRHRLRLDHLTTGART